MASVKQHYDEHLGPIYGWMIGDLAVAQENMLIELRDAGIGARSHEVAIDLGAGPGVYSIPLADLGYSVTVHDILYARGASGWDMTVSAYPKIRLDPVWAHTMLTGLGMGTTIERGPRGTVRLVATA